MDERLAAELAAEIREFLATEGAAVFAREAGAVTGRGLAGLIEAKLRAREGFLREDL